MDFITIPQNPKILLVDDDDVDQFKLQNIFRKLAEDAEITLAETPQEAQIEVTKTLSQDQKHFDLIVVDMYYENSQNGVDFIEWAREHVPPSKIALISSVPRDRLVLRHPKLAVLLKRVRYIPKLASINKISRLLIRWIDHPSRERSHRLRWQWMQRKFKRRLTSLVRVCLS